MTIGDIQTLTRFLTKTDTASLTAAQLLIFNNMSYERVTGKILAETAGSKWKYGDANYTAFPTYTLNLTNGTRAYDIDVSLVGGTYPANYQPIMILGVEVQDQNGNYYLIEPITYDDIRKEGTSQSEFMETSGRPQYYEKRENQIVLYPAPDNGVSVTLTAGLRIFYLRTADKFTSTQVTTGTKEPGFPSPWHDILAWESAYLYAVTNGTPNANFFKAETDRRERELLNFMARRNQDDRPILTMKKINYF